MKPGFQPPSAAGRLPDAVPPRPSGGRRAGPLTLRLVLALALFPLVPSSTFVISTAIDVCWSSRPGWFDHLQFWMLAGTVGVTLLSLWIWRACVVWTAGRYAGTILAAAVPIAQVLWWQPLWKVGCGTEEVLRVYQSTGGVGLWVWVTVWVWWGWTRLGHGAQGRLRMSDSAKRVVLSFGLIPVVIAGYGITGVYLDEVVSADDATLVFCGDLVAELVVAVLVFATWLTPRRLSSSRKRMAGCIGLASIFSALVCLRLAIKEPQENAGLLSLIHTTWATMAALLWSAIWYSTVEWSWAVRMRTMVAAVVFIGVGWGASYLPASNEALNCLRYMLPLMAWGGWMMATVRLWRFRPTPLPARIEECLRCRSCGYSLKGLYTTRCPECGEHPTLDELFAAVAGADDA